MEQAVVEVGHLSEPQAVLVVEMARNMNELYGATDDYVVTREFAQSAPRRAARGPAAHGVRGRARPTTASRASESAELNEVGKELGFRADEVDAIRVEFSRPARGAPGDAPDDRAETRPGSSAVG